MEFNAPASTHCTERQLEDCVRLLWVVLFGAAAPSDCAASKHRWVGLLEHFSVALYVDSAVAVEFELPSLGTIGRKCFKKAVTFWFHFLVILVKQVLQNVQPTVSVVEVRIAETANRGSHSKPLFERPC